MAGVANGWTLALLVTLAGPAAAAAQTPAPSAPPQFDAVVACRAMADNTQRLACYDAAVGRLSEAEKTGDIVVVGREQARAARRQAFGLHLPSLSIFERGLKPEEADRVTADVAQVRRMHTGRWQVTLVDGAIWEQVDDTRVVRDPKSGSSVELKQTPVGGYFMSVDGQRAMRARRIK
jgi:hypothetical protein